MRSDVDLQIRPEARLGGEIDWAALVLFDDKLVFSASGATIEKALIKLVCQLADRLKHEQETRAKGYERAWRLTQRS